MLQQDAPVLNWGWGGLIQVDAYNCSKIVTFVGVLFILNYHHNDNYIMNDDKVRQITRQVFVDGYSEDAVSEVTETAADNAATATDLNMADDSRQTKFVRLGTRHVPSLHQQAELFHPAGRMGLLNDVAVRANNYHRRVRSTSLHAHTHIYR